MSHYRVRARFGDVEIEVESSEKDYADNKLREMMSVLGSPKGFGSGQAHPPVAPASRLKATDAGGKRLSMVEYVRSLSPKSGTQYVVAVGDYLEKHGGMDGGFRTRDIVAAFQAIKYKHANPAEAVRQAKQQGFLMDGKEAGTMVVTHTGEAWVKGQLTSGQEGE